MTNKIENGRPATVSGQESKNETGMLMRNDANCARKFGIYRQGNTDDVSTKELKLRQRHKRERKSLKTFSAIVSWIKCVSEEMVEMTRKVVELASWLS